MYRLAPVNTTKRRARRTATRKARLERHAILDGWGDGGIVMVETDERK